MPKQNRGAALRWRKDRGQWEIQWYEHGRRRARSCGTGVREEAERELAQFITQRGALSSHIGATDRLITDLLLAYYQEHGVHTADPERIRHCVVPLMEFFIGKRTSDIKDPLCRAYAAQRFHKDRETGQPTTRKISDGTIRRELTALSAAIAHDIKMERQQVPAPSVWRPAAPPAKERWLTRKEVAALLWASRYQVEKEPVHGQPPRFKGSRQLTLFILIGIYTAGRKSDILRLTWDQVDLDRRLIDFRLAGDRQTNKKKGVVKIPRRLVRFLYYAKRHSNSAYLFPATNPNAKTPHMLDLKKGFKAAVERAGIAKATPHTLRHSAATWMAMSDVPMPVIAHYLNHGSVVITEKVYAKYSPSYLAQAADAFDRPAHLRSADPVTVLVT